MVRRSNFSLTSKAKLALQSFPRASFISTFRFTLQCLLEYPLLLSIFFKRYHFLLILFYCPDSVLHNQFVPNGLIPFPIYEEGPKNNENFFWGGERGVTSVCSRLVRVRDCPPHQLAKRRP